MLKKKEKEKRMVRQERNYSAPKPRWSAIPNSKPFLINRYTYDSNLPPRHSPLDHRVSKQGKIVQKAFNMTKHSLKKWETRKLLTASEFESPCKNLPNQVTAKEYLALCM